MLCLSLGVCRRRRPPPAPGPARRARRPRGRARGRAASQAARLRGGQPRVPLAPDYGRPRTHGGAGRDTP